MQIKTGLEEAYKKYVTIPVPGEAPDTEGDAYAQAVVDAGERVGDLLDAGKTPEEALEALHGHGLTGYMAGIAVDTVVRFNHRGDELKVAWNKHCGGTGEEKGTINPAIMTIG